MNNVLAFLLNKVKVKLVLTYIRIQYTWQKLYFLVTNLIFYDNQSCLPFQPRTVHDKGSLQDTNNLNIDNGAYNFSNYLENNLHISMRI